MLVACVITNNHVLSRQVGPLQLQYRIVAVPVKRALAEVDSEPAERVCRDLARLPNGGEPPPVSAIIPVAVPAAVSAAPTVRPPPAPASGVKEETPPPVETAGGPAAVKEEEWTGKKRTESSGECKEVQLHISESGEMTFGNGPAAGGAGGGGPVDILQQACSILDSLETGEPEPKPEPAGVPHSQPLLAAPRTSCGVPVSTAPHPPPQPQPPSAPAPVPVVKGPIRDSNKNEIEPESRPARPPDDTGQKRPAKEVAPGRPRPRIDDGRKRSSPVGYKTLKTPPKSWNPQLPRSYVGSGQKSAEPGRTVSPIAPKPPRFFKMRHSSGVAGGPPAEAARAPLLMRVDQPGLPPAVWNDQLLSASPLSLYPHLYTPARPLPFLTAPTVSMFTPPPPAHSGVSQLTYTSAPGSFSPLLAAPRPPLQRHLSAPVKSTSANGGQKPALSAAAGRSPPPPPPPASSAPTGPVSAPSSSPAVERPHISCSVPSSRPRPIERPPSAAPATVASAPVSAAAAAAAAAAARLSLNAFLQQNTVPGPTPVLGVPYSVALGSRPIANGQTSTASRKETAPLPPPPPPPPAVLRKESANNGGSRTKERPPPPSPPGSGGKPAPVSPAQARSAPPAALPVKATAEPRPPPAAAAAAAAGAAARPEKTAVTQR